jgi:hypothetical protein
MLTIIGKKKSFCYALDSDQGLQIEPGSEDTETLEIWKEYLLRLGLKDRLNFIHIKLICD